MGNRLRTVCIALALAMGYQTVAMATTLAPTSTIRMSTIRIEPTRPGGIPGSSREIGSWRDVETDSALSNKPTLKIKRRRH